MTSSPKVKILETSLNFPQKKKSLLISTKRKMCPKIALLRKKAPYLPNFCSFCSISFQDRSTLEHHVNTQHMETPVRTRVFHCSKCDYKSDHKLTFDHHSLKHAISQFECNQCQMPFLRKENLFMHLKLKHSNTNTTPGQSVWHQCPHCQYKSSFKSLMNRHIYKHNMATYSCDICQMPFINKGKFKISYFLHFIQHFNLSKFFSFLIFYLMICQHEARTFSQRLQEINNVRQIKIVP